MFSPGRLRRDDDKDWGCIGDGEGHGRMSQLGERPHSAMRTAPSHLRNVTEDLRRPPPQSLRGRSNTTTDSDVSSGPRPPLIQTESEGYDRRSAAFSTYSRTERSASIGRTLRSKASRLLRRQESNGNYSLRTIDWSEELDDSPYQTASGPSMTLKRNIRLPGRWSPPECKLTDLSAPFSQRTDFASVEQVHAVKPTNGHYISEPFNFQHLTHTENTQFRRMREVPIDELASDFSAMRASQAPQQELRGIKAETIARQNIPFHEPLPPLPRSPYSAQSPYTSRPTTPRSAPSHVSTAPPTPPMPHHGTFSSTSSLAQEEDRNPIYTLSQASPTTHSPAQSIQYPSTFQDSPVESELGSTAPGMTLSPFEFPASALDGSVYIPIGPHAVTTQDDVAHVLSPPPFEMVRTELTRVIEEDERSERRSSTVSLTKRPSTADSSLRHVKSFPSTRQPAGHARNSSVESYQQNIQCSPKKQRRSIQIIQPSFDDVIGDVPYQRISHCAPAPTVDTEADWENIIDWCYDLNAEADCNFDFARAASPIPNLDHKIEVIDMNLSPPVCPSPLDTITIQDSTPVKEEKRSSSVYSASPPRLLVPLQTALPELEPYSAVSSQSSFDSVSEATTPATSISELPPRCTVPNVNTNFSKPVAHPHQPCISSELTCTDMYEDLCQETYVRDSWSYCRPEGSAISSRSSRSPISKSSSQESFWRRSRNINHASQSSLPDLVPSRLSRERPDQGQEQAGESATTEELTGHRRSPSSLMKDVAQKNLLWKLQNNTPDEATNAHTLLPLQPAQRESALREGEYPFVPPRLSSIPAGRQRSATVVSTVKPVNISPRASRASYGLYQVNERG
ncbi:MAG: hypothetical protein OHK93_002811 [Ramalina farinacea]|uniref:CRIB domain-containing protein n=1 Tax=Ramalina farinacea TaxID=258253 RepID=A0AA43QSW6_9LECA|nr:hypothetical protein [Ramalina farinacea]